MDSPSLAIVKTCVVSDVRIYRDGIVGALIGAAGVEIRAVASFTPAAASDIVSEQTDVVVVDMGARCAIDFIRSVRQLHPQTRIVAFGVDESEGEILACAEAGVAAYVCRDASGQTLVETVMAAARGELICSPRIAASLFRRVASLADRAGAAADPLTVREVQVLGLIREGLGNKQIAAELHIAEATVKSHVHNVLEKLHVKRRAQAARAGLAVRQLRAG